MTKPRAYHGRKRWTVDEEARLRDLAATGLGWREIAVALGRGERSTKVRGWLLGVAIEPAAALERKRAALAASKARPGWREKVGDGNRRAWAGDDDRRARTAADIRARRLWIVGHQVLTTDPVAAERRNEANRRRAADRLADWAPEYCAAFKALRRKGISSPEARRMVVDLIAADVRRADARLTPFERTLAKVRAGTATIYARPVIAPLREGRA